MTGLPVVVTESAAAAIREAKEWWSENRDSDSSPIADELERAFSLLSVHPGIGAIARNVSLVGVRRIHLSRIHYHLYYRVSPHDDRIDVLAFWHTSRGSEPSLAGP